MADLLPSEMEFSARKDLSSESEYVRSEEVEESCKVFIKLMKAISSRRRVDS